MGFRAHETGWVNWQPSTHTWPRRSKALPWLALGGPRKAVGFNTWGTVGRVGWTPKRKWTYIGGNLEDFLNFHPEIWGKWIQFDEHIVFLNPLVQPPTTGSSAVRCRYDLAWKTPWVTSFQIAGWSHLTVFTTQLSAGFHRSLFEFCGWEPLYKSKYTWWRGIWIPKYLLRLGF